MSEDTSNQYVVVNYTQQPLDWLEVIRNTPGVEILDITHRRTPGDAGSPVMALIRADAATVATLRTVVAPSVRISPVIVYPGPVDPPAQGLGR